MPQNPGNGYSIPRTAASTSAKTDSQSPPMRNTGPMSGRVACSTNAWRIRSNGAAVNGRTMEIQRLIGRSLRAAADLKALGERTIYIDCDVINADGGTRVASIIGGAVALHDAASWLLEQGIVKNNFIRELVAAVSIGIVDGELRIDLNQIILRFYGFR